MTENEQEQARARLRQLAREYIDGGDPLGWFDVFYRSAGGNAGAIPWANLEANSLLGEWMAHHPISGEGKRALVVGCGLGDDAEMMARAGFDVTAFDISPEAIHWCQRRFPDSSVHYFVANLLALPEEWGACFDFILESYTLQSLPNVALREEAAANLARSLAPGGTLLVICRGRKPEEDQGAMPWPLTRPELKVFERLGLREASFEDFLDQEQPPVRRFRAQYLRP